MTTVTTVTRLILPKMAWRNLWRNRRRTLVTLSSIVFGFLLATLFTGLGDHTYSKMINLAARMGMGHVALQHAETLDRPSLKRTITQVQEKHALALADPDVSRVVDRISGQTMLATAKSSYGAFFVAYDPRQENKNTLSILEDIVEGEAFTGPKGTGIILGHRLAKNLGLTLGRKVVYTLTDKRGEIVTGLARLSGIVKTGAASLDGGLCLLPINTVREILGYGAEEASAVAVFLKDQRRSGDVAARLGSRLGAREAAVPWFTSQPELAGFISMKVGGTLFFEILIAILVAAGIFNTLFVSVMERMREFGIMMAIGYSPGRLFSLVMWESAWVALMGILLGVVATAWPYYYMSTTGIDMSAMIGKDGAEVAGVGIDMIMKVGIYPESAIFITAAVILATLLSGLYPAWRAGRVVPVESIKLV